MFLLFLKMDFHHWQSRRLKHSSEWSFWTLEPITVSWVPQTVRFTGKADKNDRWLHLCCLEKDLSEHPCVWYVLEWINQWGFCNSQKNPIWLVSLDLTSSDYNSIYFSILNIDAPLTLVPQGNHVKGSAFRGQLGHESSLFRSRTSAFMKWSQKTRFRLSTMQKSSTKTVFTNWKSSPCQTLTLLARGTWMHSPGLSNPSIVHKCPCLSYFTIAT